ncbi:LrgB family protein [Paenibacillus rigui]|uniref:CidB/LrgB family autolysis modulator n=1 Tax=Paenibacillus rigui TaxID=554312 RepID=A0A229US57_9BACL|nr:LrgB family protein [Paenibacillus rigui]OXM86467.1 CidB/LrgB family autolysis modulator [Paenibacillus rigui]
MNLIALGCLAATIAIYMLTKRFYQKVPKLYFTPLLLTPAIVVLSLVLSGIPYESYHEGTHWLSDMIGPATVALAVPLYKNMAVLKKHAFTVLVSVMSGAMVAILSSAWLAKELHLSTEIMESLAPRSATTPIAMAVSQLTGGVPTITALFVLMTGLLGMLIGPVIIRIFRIRNDIARGVLLGTSAHTAGTSKAFEFSSISGSISSIAMILTAFITLLITPWALQWFL